MHLRQRQRCTKGDENPLLAARRLEAFDTVGKPLPTGLAGGADLQMVKDRLGHGSISTTEKYLHTLPDGDDDALDAFTRIRTRAQGRTA
jgi:integrase